MSALDDIAWYITLLQTGGKTYDQVVFDEWIEAERADLEEVGAEMSEHIIETEVWAGTPFVPVGGTGKLREEIVRCKDCEYMERQTTYDGSMSWFLCSHFKRPTRCDGFCAWGVRS